MCDGYCGYKKAFDVFNSQSTMGECRRNVLSFLQKNDNYSFFDAFTSKIMPPMIGTSAVIIPSKVKYIPFLKIDIMPTIINAQPIIFMI